MPYRPSPLPIAQTIATTVSCSFFIAALNSALKSEYFSRYNSAKTLPFFLIN
jgi:hypothetical protein